MFREGTCPRCREVIQVPDDREKIICMYCGEEILVKEALGSRKTIDYVAYGEYYNKAMAQMQDVVWKCCDPMKNFRKDKYESVFEEYYSSHREMFEAIQFVYQYDENPEKWLKKLADQLVEQAEADLKTYKSRGKRNQRLLDLNLELSVYLIPAMRKYLASFSEPLADCLLETWNRTFKTSIGKASFDEIEGGFHRKLCYITTAVCESLGKGTDCYELNVLRAYRDQYLDRTPEGHAMVEEYYDLAPTIVKRMAKEPDRDDLYRELYENYLVPCIHQIEAQEYEACRDRYQEMVLNLKARYMS